MSKERIKLYGYKRADGKYGIRNHVMVIPASICAGQTAENISNLVQGSFALTHKEGCCQVGSDYEQTVRTLIGVGRNANVAAVLVVSLGCEGIQADVLVEGIKATGKPVFAVNIQECGGTLRAVETGAKILRKLVQEASVQKRSLADISGIILGLECGGSDATSGLVANPVVGAVSDLLIHCGGTSILSETTELIGAEHLLAKRAVNNDTARQLLNMVKRTEARAVSIGVDLRGSQPTPGNIAGGISTIEEKSLGCIYKAGQAPLAGVLEYAQAPQAKGLFFMDTPGQDIESITGMVAGGAQIIIFTTGRGTPTGSPVAPVIKITGNSKTYNNMSENIDIDTGGIIDRQITIQDMGEKVFAELIEVCNGKLTKAELLGHYEFSIFRVGYTF